MRECARARCTRVIGKVNGRDGYSAMPDIWDCTLVCFLSTAGRIRTNYSILRQMLEQTGVIPKVYF